jgi:hypothetical protein
MIAAIQTTCPQEIAAIYRKATNRRRERQIRAEVVEWCKGKVCSCGCGRLANLAHHPADDLYILDPIYKDLDNCEPYFHRCHYMMHKEFVRCPGCGGWMKKGSEKCSKCRGWRPRNKRHTRHPCAANTGSQRCSLNGVCHYSPQKSKNCRKFIERVRVN